MQTGSGETTLTAVLRLRDEMSPQLVKPQSALASMGGAFDVLKKAATKAMVIIQGSLILMAKSVMNTADELDRLNKQSGVSVETLQKLAFVAAESGASLQDVGNGMKFLGRSLNAAKNGSQETVESFRLLGISIDEIKDPGMNTEKMFYRIADSMQYLSDEQKQEVFKVMGRGVSELIPLLSQGSEAILAVGEAAKKTGAIMSNEAVDALDSFGDQLNGVGMAIKGMFGELLAAEVISIPKMIEGFGTFMKAVNGAKVGFVFAFKTITNALIFAAVTVDAIFKAIVDTVAISMAKVVDKVRTPVMKLAELWNDAGLMSDETFGKLRRGFEDMGVLAQRGLGDPFKELAVTIKQNFKVAQEAQGTFLDEAKTDYKEAAASVDLFVDRTTKAAELQTKMGRDKAVKENKGQDSASKSLDDLIKMGQAMTIVTALQKKMNDQADDFAQKTGIRLTAEQMQQLYAAAEKSDAAVTKLFEDIQKATEADPLRGMQLAIYDLTQKTFNFREAWGKVFDDLKAGFSETFANALDGTEKFSDGFKKVMKDLKRNLLKMFTDFAVNSIFGAAGGGLMSLFGGGNGNSPGAPGTANVAGASGGMGGAGGLVSGVMGGLGSAMGVSGATAGAVAGLGAAGAAVAASGVSNGNVTQGTLGGLVAGASAGAMIGSVIPGIGTAIGAVVGGIVGAAVGYFGSSRKKRKKAREAARRQREALAAYEAALQQARVVLKMDIRNKMGGGLATQDAAAEIGHLFSEDLSAEEIQKFGDPAAIAANASAVNQQRNVNVGGITVNAQISGSYDVQRLARDLSYHMQAEMGGA